MDDKLPADSVLLKLPPELISLVLTFLDSKSLAKTTCTCTYFARRGLSRCTIAEQAAKAQLSALLGPGQALCGPPALGQPAPDRGLGWLQRLWVEETGTAFDLSACDKDIAFDMPSEQCQHSRMQLNGNGPKLLVSQTTTQDAPLLRWKVKVVGNTACEFGIVPDELRGEEKALHKRQAGPVSGDVSVGCASHLTVGSCLLLRLPVGKFSVVEVCVWRVGHVDIYLESDPDRIKFMEWAGPRVKPSQYKGPSMYHISFPFQYASPARLAITFWAHSAFEILHPHDPATLPKPSPIPRPVPAPAPLAPLPAPAPGPDADADMEMSGAPMLVRRDGKDPGSAVHQLRTPGISSAPPRPWQEPSAAGAAGPSHASSSSSLPPLSHVQRMYSSAPGGRGDGASGSGGSGSMAAASHGSGAGLSARMAGVGPGGMAAAGAPWGWTAPSGLTAASSSYPAAMAAAGASGGSSIIQGSSRAEAAGSGSSNVRAAAAGVQAGHSSAPQRTHGTQQARQLQAVPQQLPQGQPQQQGQPLQPHLYLPPEFRALAALHQSGVAPMWVPQFYWRQVQAPAAAAATGAAVVPGAPPHPGAVAVATAAGSPAALPGPQPAPAGAGAAAQRPPPWELPQPPWLARAPARPAAGLSAAAPMYAMSSAGAAASAALTSTSATVQLVPAVQHNVPSSSLGDGAGSLSGGVAGGQALEGSAAAGSAGGAAGSGAVPAALPVAFTGPQGSNKRGLYEGFEEAAKRPRNASTSEAGG